MGLSGRPKTPGSGRKKNTRNKDSVPLKQKAAELGIDPFEILLYFAAGDWKKLGYTSETYTVYSKDVSNEEYTIQPSVRAKAAGEACQYIYPKLKAVEHSGPLGEPITIQDLTEEEIDSKLAKLLAKVIVPDQH